MDSSLILVSPKKFYLPETKHYLLRQAVSELIVEDNHWMFILALTDTHLYDLLKDFVFSREGGSVPMLILNSLSIPLTVVFVPKERFSEEEVEEFLQSLGMKYIRYEEEGEDSSMIVLGERPGFIDGQGMLIQSFGQWMLIDSLLN